MIDYSESVVKKAFHVPEYCRVILALLIFVFCFSLTVLADEPIDAPSSKPLPALTGNAQTDFLAVAYSQLGYEATEDNYSEYWIWAGSRGKNSWCTEFVAWCADKANISHIIPLRWGSGDYRKYFAEKRMYYSLLGGCADPVCGCSRMATAQLSVNELMPGDILLKDTNNNMSDGSDHTCIFVRREGDAFFTIDGNVRRNGGPVGRVTERKYNLSEISRFHGACRPDWNEKKQDTPEPSTKKPQPMTVNKKTVKYKIQRNYSEPPLMRPHFYTSAP